MATHDVSEIVAVIATRNAKRPEAQLQAEIYKLLTIGVLQLDVDDVAQLEVQTGDGTRRRIDIELGHCCIEVKKDLRLGSVLASAREQLSGYIEVQASKYGTRYVGIVTDGVSWHLHRLVDEQLVEVAVFTASRDQPDALLVWLESVLATQHNLRPTPGEIRKRLGASSPAHQLDHATLSDLFDRGHDRPEVQVKRDLWAKLLRTAFGSAFTDTPRLFIDHTLLVLTAEAIAHAVAGFDLTAGDLSAADIARGTRFHDAQIYGVVEEDFFDWVLDVDGGPEFVRELARRIGRFDWTTEVEHDVLKALYTSVMPVAEREALGEYYTPDWLAEQMVADVYTDPLHQRLLEPSCGSGTFLIHAIRAHLAAAEGSGLSAGEAVASAAAHVTGMDIHPVSVTLARVSYLLAIGTQRLNDDTRGPLTVPVYLGDSMQWEQREDLLSSDDEITISTAGDDLVHGGGALFGDELRFPRAVLANATNFDRLVSAMADKAITANQPAEKVMKPVLNQRGIHDPAARGTLIATFQTMRRLHENRRNHIWGYYVRNLIRPIWLAEPTNRADVLVGNPPWLAFSKMTGAMQERYRALAQHRRLISGGRGAAGRDLSTLFVARCIELYLKLGGRFAFVMPHGALSRKPHTGFRGGKWPSESSTTTVAFDASWDLDQVTTGFPMSSCVVRGRSAANAKPLPPAVTAWTGRLTNPDIVWEVAQHRISRTDSTVRAIDAGSSEPESPYRTAFRQGAILVPRYLLFVNKTDTNPLGAGAGRVFVESARTTQEKPPWKTAPSLSGAVEKRFLREVYLGENVAPFRLLDPRDAVLPLSDNEILEPGRIAEQGALSKWWSDVEAAWAVGRKQTEKASLLDRFDYHGQLSAQLPTATHRVVYSKAGTTIAAARLSGTSAIIDHKLYWAAVASAEEGRYLTAILNSQALLARVTPLQTRGLFGARDFDKYVFAVPIPLFDTTNDSHVELAGLAAEAEEAANKLVLEEGARFQAKRKVIRQHLDRTGIAARIETAVTELIPGTESMTTLNET